MLPRPCDREMFTAYLHLGWAGVRVELRSVDSTASQGSPTCVEEGLQPLFGASVITPFTTAVIQEILIVAEVSFTHFYMYPGMASQCSCCSRTPREL